MSTRETFKDTYITLVGKYVTVGMREPPLEPLILSVRVVDLERHGEQALVGHHGRFGRVLGLVVDHAPGARESVRVVHVRIQIEIDEHVLAVDEAELVRRDHDVADKVRAAAQKHHAELVAHVVDENGLDGPLVELVAYLVVHGDLRVEQGRFQRGHRQVAIEVGVLLLKVLVEQEYHLFPFEVLEDLGDELVEPVHGRADVGERFVLGEFVLAEVLGRGAHGYDGHVPERRVTCHRCQRT